MYTVIDKSLRDFRPLRYSSRDSHAEGEHVNRGRETPKFLSYLTGTRYVHPWRLSWLLRSRVRKFRGDLTNYPVHFFIISRRIRLRVRNVSENKKVQRKSERTFHVQEPPPHPESRAVYDVMWKKNIYIYIYIYCRAGQASDDIMAHAQCMLDPKAYVI